MAIFKTGVCLLCPPSRGEQKLYAKDLCHFHYWNQNARDNSLKKNTLEVLVNQEPNLLPNLTLHNWFGYHLTYSTRTCENCGQPLIYPNKDTAYSCQAHIIPKEHFPSVM